MRSKKQIRSRRTVAVVCAVVMALILFVPWPIQSTSSSSACAFDPTSPDRCNDSMVVEVSFLSIFQLLVQSR